LRFYQLNVAIVNGSLLKNLILESFMTEILKC
jgi:hypothetical protein